MAFRFSGISCNIGIAVIVLATVQGCMGGVVSMVEPEEGVSWALAELRSETISAVQYLSLIHI